MQDRSVYAGESFDFEHRGRMFRASIEFDDSHGAPWEECDGFAPIERKPHGYGARYGAAKRPGEVVIHDGGRNGYAYVVDLTESLAIARRDKWGISAESRAAFTIKHGRPPTPREVARLAVDENIAFSRGWCADDWCFVGVIVQMIGRDGEPVGESESLWGVESCGAYARDDVAPELAEQIIGPMRDAWLDSLQRARRVHQFAKLAAVMAAPLQGVNIS